jgi:hypothetical protein
MAAEENILAEKPHIPDYLHQHISIQYPYLPAQGAYDMTMNVGPADKYIRFLAGVSLLLQIIILSPGWLGTVIFLVLGGAMLLTASKGFCWLYQALNITSCAAPRVPDAPAEAHGH